MKGFDRQGSFQVWVNPDQNTCSFGKSTMAKAAATNQIVFDDIHRTRDEITEQLVRNKAEQFVLDLIAGKFKNSLVRREVPFPALGPRASSFRRCRDLPAIRKIWQIHPPRATSVPPRTLPLEVL